MSTLTTSYQLIKTGSSQQFGYATGYLQIYAKYNSQDKVNNTTSVSYRLNLVVSGGYIGDYTGNKPVVITGTTNSQTTYIGNDNYYSRELGTYTETITHNQDGTKSGTCSGSVNFTGWQTTLTTGTGNFDLPPIQRASKLTSASMNISNDGNSITVTPVFTKNVPTYYDCLVIKDLTYDLDIVTLDGVTNNTASSLSSGYIIDIYGLIGTATTKTFSCYLKTYSDSTKTTLIGNSTSVNLTATLPTYNISITSSVADSVSTYNTYKPNLSTFITNLSKPTFTFSASSSTGSYYGRTPTFTLNDVSVTSPYTETEYTGQSFTLKATDGRKSATATPTMTVVEYFKPTLTVNLIRYTETSIDVNVSGTYYSGTGLTNLGNPTLTLKYTESGSSEQTTTITLFTTTSGNVVRFTGSKTLTGMDYHKSLTYSAIISDKLGVTQTNNGTLAQIPVWFAYRNGGINHMKINGDLTTDYFYGREVDFEANDTAGFRVLAINGEKIQHRVITPDLNKRYVKSLTSKSHTDYSNDGTKLPDISMISYWNGAYNSSNSSNLTYAHQGTIQCKPTSLYENSTGVTGNVSLSQTAGNFNYLEIFYYGKIGGTDWYQSMRVFSPNNKKVALITANGLSNAMAIGVHTMTISGTSITNNYNGTYSSFGAPGGTNEVYVYKVLGWK